MTRSEPTFHIADWETNQGTLKNIRKKVFIDEQKVPESMEWDEFDSVATHYITRLDNEVIACARLKPDGQIGRMAVLRDFRNRGIGSRLLKFVLINAEQKKYPDVYLHAQIKALKFYQRHGFKEEGEVFDEAGIPHQMMRLKL
jgi:predicted GNAT family N-acyltransferase